MTLSKDRFDEEVAIWLDDNPSWLSKIGAAALSFWYNRAPRRWSFFGVAHGVAHTAMASSAPGLALWYGAITAWQATLGAGAIFIGHGVVRILDSLSKEKDFSKNDLLTDAIVRLGDILSVAKYNSYSSEHERAKSIAACLGVLELYAMQKTRSKKGQISVSLILYAGRSATRMKIHGRNPGNLRPVNREFDCRGLLGHRACVAGGLPRVVHDIRRFGAGAVSPTQSKPTYRSIFFVPLEGEVNGTSMTKGFISFDCDRPYAFFGNRTRDVIITCEPVISHVKELISEDGHGAQVEGSKRRKRGRNQVRGASVEAAE